MPKQPLTEDEMLGALERGELQLPPLRLDRIHSKAPIHDRDLDAVAHLRWGKKNYRIAIQCKASSFPKSIDAAIRQAQAAAQRLGSDVIPLILVPFLSEEQLVRLEQEQVSGIDFCGNGLVVVPSQLLVKRSGQPNRFVREGIIKNIYRGVSSLVARTFLLDRHFESLRDVQKAINKREGNLTLATISKVTTSLERELIVERRKHSRHRTQELRLLQADKLLDRLTANFVSPQTSGAIAGKLKMPVNNFTKWADDWELSVGERLVRSGADSVETYAAMARQPAHKFYCTNLVALQEDLGSYFAPSERFAEIQFLQTDDDTVYFDRRPGHVASPIQTYLELMIGDKRDRETAEQVRKRILTPAGLPVL